MTSFHYHYYDPTYPTSFINYFKQKGYPEKNIRIEMEQTNLDANATLRLLEMMKQNEQELNK